MSTQSRIEREKYGPSLAEVALGAALSLLLGIVLGAAYLVTKPVETVRVLPKDEDRPRGQVYFVEGSRDGGQGRTWLRKRQLLLEGQSAEIPLTEAELNAGLNEAPAPAAGSTDGFLIEPAGLNFRIRDGLLQVAAPSTLNLLGYQFPIVIQAQGTFARRGDRVEFVPVRMYVGSLAASRLPLVRGFITSRVLAARPVAPELAEAWSRVTAATIAGETLTLTLP